MTTTRVGPKRVSWAETIKAARRRRSGEWGRAHSIVSGENKWPAQFKLVLLVHWQRQQKRHREAVDDDDDWDDDDAAQVAFVWRRPRPQRRRPRQRRRHNNHHDDDDDNQDLLS